MNNQPQPVIANSELSMQLTPRRSFLTMKKIIIGIVVLALLVVGTYFFFASGKPAETPAAVAAPPAAAAKAVVAEAKVVPARSAALSLPIGGLVAEVLVSEGDQVTAGQVIARLDVTQL